MNVKNWIQRKGHQIKHMMIHEPKRVAVLLIGFNALFQLALSQIHIASLVKVKLTISSVDASNYTSGMPSMGIGMFNFLFILFGLVTIFNTSRASENKKVFIALSSIFLTLITGGIYLLKMVNPDNIVNYSDVGPSVNLMLFAIILYLIGAAFLIYELLRTKKEI